MRASGEVSVVRTMGTYASSTLPLGPHPLAPYESLDALLLDASSSSRKCISEGTDGTLPTSDLLRCRGCGHTVRVGDGTPARKYEEHDFEPYAAAAVASASASSAVVAIEEAVTKRVRPSDFRERLLRQMPMRVVLEGFGTNDVQECRPEDGAIDDELWEGWVDALNTATTVAAAGEAGAAASSGREPAAFKFSRLDRSGHWTATFISPNGSRLELRIDGGAGAGAGAGTGGAIWFLFVEPPVKRGRLREFLERPVARMRVRDGDGRRGGKMSRPLSLRREAYLPLPVQER